MITLFDDLCELTNSKGYRSTDNNLDDEYIACRYREFLRLKSLPFLSDLQATRLCRLSTLRVRDNRASFEAARMAKIAELVG